MEKKEQRTVEELDNVREEVAKTLKAHHVTRAEAIYVCSSIIADVVYQSILDKFIDEMKQRKKGGK